MLCSLQWTLVCPFSIFVLLVRIEGVSAELHSQVGVCASRGSPARQMLILLVSQRFSYSLLLKLVP